MSRAGDFVRSVADSLKAFELTGAEGRFLIRKVKERMTKTDPDDCCWECDGPIAVDQGRPLGVRCLDPKCFASGDDYGRRTLANAAAEETREEIASVSEAAESEPPPLGAVDKASDAHEAMLVTMNSDKDRLTQLRGELSLLASPESEVATPNPRMTRKIRRLESLIFIYEECAARGRAFGGK